MISTNNTYTQRNPRKSQYYKCVEEHFEELENKWEDNYQHNFGYWRHHITDVIYKYLDCGDLHCGFARVKCKDCNNEYLLPFSCKKRHFCPSCHQKRVVEFGEYLVEDVLKKVPHRQWVFSIPKRIRTFFYV
jgi:ribosomal protein S27E